MAVVGRKGSGFLGVWTGGVQPRGRVGDSRRSVRPRTLSDRGEPAGASRARVTDTIRRANSRGDLAPLAPSHRTMIVVGEREERRATRDTALIASEQRSFPRPLIGQRCAS